MAVDYAGECEYAPWLRGGTEIRHGVESQRAVVGGGEEDACVEGEPCQVRYPVGVAARGFG